MIISHNPYLGKDTLLSCSELELNMLKTAIKVTLAELNRLKLTDYLANSKLIDSYTKMLNLMENSDV